MNDLMTRDDATRILGALSAELAAAVTVSDADRLDVVRRKSAALQQAMKLARFSLVDQNRAAILRLNAMGEIGEILKETLPHQGGRPVSRDNTAEPGRPPGETVPGADSSPSPTLDQLGF